MKENAKSSAAGGAVYGLGFIGAAIYFISTAATFWMGVLGLLKAIVWPVFLVYEAMRHLGYVIALFFTVRKDRDQ
jgi:hypothetical protein